MRLVFEVLRKAVLKVKRDDITNSKNSDSNSKTVFIAM